MTDLITTVYHEEGTIAEVTLNRSDKRNALNQDLLNALHTGIDAVQADEKVRVIILAGEGRCFCAGMDLKAVLSEPAKMGDLLLRLSEVLRLIRRAPQPVIARVQGAAIGGGCGLMSVCDFTFTHADARIGYPEVDLAVCPAVVAPWLIKKVGAGRARQLLLAGGTFDGQYAYETGLVSHIVDMDDLTSAANNFALELTKGGKIALARTKAWLNHLDGSLDDEEIEGGARISAEIVQGEEAQTRLQAVFGSR